MAEEKAPPVCSWYLVKEALRAITTDAAMIEVSWDKCHIEKIKGACEVLTEKREKIEKDLDLFIQELRVCVQR